jgi:hypothetical protein
MEFLLAIEEARGEPLRAQVGAEEMTKFAAELRAAGALVCAAGPLHPESEGARVRVRDGRTRISDGPFAESDEIVRGYFVVRAASHEDALAIARRCPWARAGRVSVREAFANPDELPAGGARRFALFTREGPNPELRDGDAEYRDMMAFLNGLRAERRYVHGFGLPRQAARSRVEVRGGQPAVTDGPFSEAKEVVGGLLLIEAGDPAHALALAARCKHAEWGSIEVREVVKTGPS